MSGDPLEPGHYAERLLERVPELAALAELQTRIICNLDSSDVGPSQWRALALEVESCRPAVDGVVIVHGTDTMAYTASALAFALQGLDLPVVLTGAQLPLASLRTDARRNLQDAVTVATTSICEVGICFDGSLYRGCRAVKNDARTYRAFASPGVPPLAMLGIGVDHGPHVRQPNVPFHCVPDFDPRVGVAYLHPGMNPDILRNMVAAGTMRGLVLAAFGVGNAPRAGRPVGDAVREVVDSGVDVVVVTQWGGKVDLGAYQTGIDLRDAGAIPGGRMRIEAAVPKLMHALANHPDDAVARRRWLTSDVAGEFGT